MAKPVPRPRREDLAGLDLVTMDPGKWEVGLARFAEGKLIDAYLPKLRDYGLSDFDRRWELGMESLAWIRSCDFLAFERMEFRSERADAVDDILELQLVSGLIQGIVRPRVGTFDVLPSKWTGRRNKTRNHREIVAQLDEDEKRIVAATLHHTAAANHKEIMDAIGIGLWMLRRLP